MDEQDRITGADPGQDKDVLKPQPSVRSVPSALAAEEDCPGAAMLYAGLDVADLAARLCDGDPLHLYERVVHRAREAAYLIDGERLQIETLAQIAALVPPPERADLHAWIDRRIDAAIFDLLARDREVLSSGNASLPEGSLAFLEQAFGVDPARALKRSVAFNGMLPERRRAFIALFVEDRTVPECLEAGLGTLEELQAFAREGLRALTGRKPETRDASAILGGEA